MEGKINTKTLTRFLAGSQSAGDRRAFGSKIKFHKSQRKKRARVVWCLCDWKLTIHRACDGNARALIFCVKKMDEVPRFRAHFLNDD